MNKSALENFEKNHKPSAKKSVFLEYIEDIEYLLLKGFSRKQVYEYLQQTYRIVETIDALYKFLKKHNLKPFLKNIEPVKEEEPKQQPKPQEQKQYKDRTEEYKRYKEIYKISKVTSDYKKLLSKNEFEKAMNILQEVQKLDFMEIENGISGKYDEEETAKLIVTYMAFVITILNDKEEKDPQESLKGHTPKMWRSLMGSGNVFQNFLGSD